MFIRVLVLFLVLLFPIEKTWAVSGDNFDYHGYLRAGSGSNTKGGTQNCFHQSGTPGNEFRLGNECGIYGEAYFQAYTQRTKDLSNDEFWRSNFDLSYNPSGNTVTQAPNLYIFGAFIEAAHLDGGPETLWVGRRFYRDADVHMDDFFYFADTSGSGGGIQDIPIGTGKGHFAIMMQDTDKNNLTSNSTTQQLPAQTESGRPRTVLFDGRLFGLKLATQHELSIWAGFAMLNGGGQDVNTGQLFSDARGEVLGLKYNYKNDAGYNNLAVIHGRGLMQGMNLGGYFGADPAQLLNGKAYHDSAHRTRVVEEFMFQTSPHFATAFAAIYETWNTGVDLQSGRWISVGARPILFLSDHYSIAFEAGASTVRQSSPTVVSSHPLTRFTIAPQVSPKLSFFSRPVLRAFLTDTPTETNGISYGFQGEVWF
jgi:maltoporin